MALRWESAINHAMSHQPSAMSMFSMFQAAVAASAPAVPAVLEHIDA
jgi:hypothetical protein